MTNTTSDEHSHEWRCYGSMESFVVCDDCGVGVNIQDLVANSVNSLLDTLESELEEVIGRDELKGMVTPLQWEIAQDHNALRIEQRKKLKQAIERHKL